MSNKELLPDFLLPLAERLKLVFKPSGKGSLTVEMAELSANLLTDPSEEVVLGDRERIDLVLRGALQRWMGSHGWEVSQCNPPTAASFKRNVEVAGTSYKPKTIAWGDSYILVGTESDWRPAQVQSIFSAVLSSNNRRMRNTFIGICSFRPLSPPDVDFDHYRKFRRAGGRIYYNEELPLEVIGTEEIVSHFAYTPNVCDKISASHFHALPLTRVRIHG